MILQEPPEGIIITISQTMLKERGIKNWLREFFTTMDNENFTYWMRLGAKPKHEIQYVYINIANAIGYRVNFSTFSSGEMVFNDGRSMTAKTWCVTHGPIVRVPYKIPMKGFRGFRYSEKLF